MPHFVSTLQRRFSPVSPLSRREMIQRSLAAAAGLLVSGSGVFAQSTRPHGRVIVVGAGFAGLAAAFELKAAGFDVHVIEARNRIGGRVLTFFDFIRGKHVEGGGELVGANHPVWLAYRDRFKLTFRDVTEEELDVPVVLQGQRLSAADAEALWKELEAATGLMNDPARAIGDPYRPWTAANAAALDGQSLADWIASRPDLTDRCKHALALSFVADNGVEADRQSLLGLLAMIKGAGVERFWTETEVFRCDGGNQLLARRLATAIGLDRITLKMPVRRIVSSERGVRVHGSDGSAREADFAVLAVPPSTWRRLAVEPPLPSTLTPQMGENVKYLMALGTRAWRRDQLAADSFTDGPIHLTWEQTQGQPGAAASLIAFSGAAAARQCRSWPAAERAARYRDALGTLYPTVARSILRTRFMDWPGDPWTAASYSFPAPGELTTSGALLQEAHGRMYFAGEHTCPAFPGYMEGALQSGARVAKQIAARAQVLTPTSSVAGPSPSGATRS